VQRSSVGGPRKDPRRGKRLLGILPNALKQRIPRRIKRTEGSKEWFAQGCTSMDASEGQDKSHRRRAANALWEAQVRRLVARPSRRMEEKDL